MPMSMSSPARGSVQVGFLAAAFSAASLSFAVAGETSNCADSAKRAMDRTPGQVLSVTSGKGRCVVVFLMHREGQRPKRVVLDLTNETRLYHSIKPNQPALGEIRAVRE
jgi:hypothetical protein